MKVSDTKVEATSLIVQDNITRSINGTLALLHEQCVTRELHQAEAQAARHKMAALEAEVDAIRLGRWLPP